MVRAEQQHCFPDEISAAFIQNIFTIFGLLEKKAAHYIVLAQLRGTSADSVSDHSIVNFRLCNSFAKVFFGFTGVHFSTRQASQGGVCLLV